jgi:hypothetical protein
MKQKSKIQTQISLFLAIVAALSFSCSTNNAPTAPTNKTGLTVSVVTSSANGIYAPKNVVAIWIENSEGQFIKTLTIYAKTRVSYLTNWESASGGNTVDALSGATQTTHGTIYASWNGTDAKGFTAPDGNYKVCMELTDKNSTGSFSSFIFSKDAITKTYKPGNTPSFSTVTIKWVPL